MTIDPSLLYRIAFASMRGLTPALARAILARTGTEERFFSLTAEQISASDSATDCLTALYATRHSEKPRTR